jgi:hypothetical protein
MRVSQIITIVTTAAGVVTAAGALWAFGNKITDPIANSLKNSFNSWIISAIQQEITKSDSDLMKDIKHQISTTIVDSALKHKLGPLYAERFTLESANPHHIVELFWRPSYSTKLWVKL